MTASAVRAIRDDLRAFVGTYTFEDLCREWVWGEANRGGLGFTPEVMGSYWARSQRKRVLTLPFGFHAILRGGKT